MNRKEILKTKLSVLKPHILHIIDESAKHAGHAGNPDNLGQTHYYIEISSTKLDGLSKISQHRKINKLLQQEFENGLHALRLKII